MSVQGSFGIGVIQLLQKLIVINDRSRSSLMPLKYGIFHCNVERSESASCVELDYNHSTYSWLWKSQHPLCVFVHMDGNSRGL